MAYDLFLLSKCASIQKCQIDRDRFVLSAGHGSMLLYALLHLSGFFKDVTMEEIKEILRSRSKTPGHPGI